MTSGRPRTAPPSGLAVAEAEESREDVNALVSEMFRFAASTAKTTKDDESLPPRPATACIDRRPATASNFFRSLDDFEESDGASVDGSGDEWSEDDESWGRPGTSAGVVDILRLEDDAMMDADSKDVPRPQTAPGHRAVDPPLVDFRSPKAQGPRELSTVEVALLGGFGARSQVTQDEEMSPNLQRASSSKDRKNMVEQQKKLQEWASSRLPKASGFMFGAVGARPPSSHGKVGGYANSGMSLISSMAPTAAKLKSHGSWANHLPVHTADFSKKMASSRTEVASSSTASKVEGVKGKGNGSGSGSVGSIGVPKGDKLANNLNAKLDKLRKSAAAGEKAKGSGREGPDRKKSNGPRYRVRPGGSRPCLPPQPLPSGIPAIGGFDFCSEPREIPASRKPSRPGSRGGEADSGFRPATSDWASQREAMAIR